LIYNNWISPVVIELALWHVIALVIATFSKRWREAFSLVILHWGRRQKSEGEQLIRILFYIEYLAFIRVICEWRLNKRWLIPLCIKSNHFLIDLYRPRFLCGYSNTAALGIYNFYHFLWLSGLTLVRNLISFESFLIWISTTIIYKLILAY
jgi:hypothetical protein